ncbi:MAG: 5'/3'-nucleotidase SurE [Verrucomicrobiota bacterium]
MPEKPLALITNDDGIDSWFLRVLVEAMVESFEVTVAAPMGEQSWIGRAMSRRREVHLAEYHDFPCTAYALDGTPADCANIAMGHLVGRTPDIVCSGINLGYNACLPLILSSGTIGGAMEGAFWGLPAIAYSHVIPQVEFEKIRANHGRVEGDFAQSLKHAADFARDFALKLVGTATDSPVVHNINFPKRTTGETEVIRTQPAPIKMQSLFMRETTGSFRFGSVERDPEPHEGQDDMKALNDGMISHTVLDISSLGRL